jgi:hypothetical protein
MVVDFQPMIQVNLVEVRGDISSPSSWVSVHRNGTCKPVFRLVSESLLLRDAESTSRLRSGMKDLGEAGLRRRLSLLAHCHMFL